MPTGVLHLKEVDTDKITLDGTLSVSGDSRLKGSTVIVDNALSVGTTTTLAADTTATNVNLTGTLSVSGQTTIGGDILPDTNDAYDIGSPEFKIRDLYVSNNSIWVGDDMKISNVNGSLKFRKRKTDEVPKAILDAGANAGHANEQATADAALAHAGVTNVADMKLQHWFKFMRTLNAAAKLTDIFRDNDDDYEETSASDAWKEIADANKIYTSSAVGVGTSDPDDTLHVKGSFKVESETGFKLIRSSVGGTDPTVIIDTQNFGTDNTVNDLTGRGDSKYTKLYRVFGRNSEGVGKSWYWGYANDDYTNFSLAFDGGGLPDPDIAFTFTTASELYCNKVYAALGGNADTATRLATPRKINGVDFDGTQDITIDTGSDGVDGITSVNGNIGIGTSSPSSRLQVGDGSNHPAGTVDADASLTLFGAGRKKVEQGKPGIYHRENVGLGLHSDYKMSFEVGGSSTLVEAMRINSLGNVGIGTDSPGQKLSIYTGSTGTAALSFDRFASGNYRTDIYQNTYGADFRVGYGTYTPESILYLKRFSDGAKKVEINGALDVAQQHGNIDSPMVHFRANPNGAHNGDGNVLLLENSGNRSDVEMLECVSSGNSRFVVKANGNVGVGNPAPDTCLNIKGRTTSRTREYTLRIDGSGADVVPLISAGTNGQSVSTIAGLELCSQDMRTGSPHGRHAYIESVSAGFGSTQNTNLEFRARHGGNYMWGGGSHPAQKQARIAYNGYIYARSGLSGTGADYAELFEWFDGNPESEDRTGMTVKLIEDGKIGIADADTPPDKVIGVISVIYGFLGNNHWDEWVGKYLKDSLGRVVTETVDMVTWRDEKDKEHTYATGSIPKDIEVPNTAKYYQDHNVPKLNPLFDEKLQYEERSKRKEWGAVGLVGRLRVLKSCPKPSRWIKLRDIDAEVEEYLAM